LSSRRSSSLVALLVLFAAAAWTIVDAGQPAPHPFFPAAPPRTADPVEVRRVQLAVANGYDRPYVEFGDAFHGYALFASYGGKPPASDCPALLLATADGGRSWHRVPHPRPLASGQRPLRGNHRLTLLFDGTLLARGPEDVLLGGRDGDHWVRVILERRRPSTDK
jgi:hypothetical protein